MSRARLALLGVLVLAIGFAAGFLVSHWLDRATIQQAREGAAAARAAQQEAEQESAAISAQLDELETDVWDALAEQPSAPKKQAAAGELRGQVVAVADGDTITVLDDTKTQYKIRLLGIDAPEKKQPFGSRAKEAMSQKVFGKQVLVKWAKKDQWGRLLGDVFLDDRWINKEMIVEGWAWHFTRYDKRAELADAEKEAREGKHGLWVDKNPESPWDYRTRMKQEQAIKKKPKVGAAP